jgi:ferredoxin-NADP reductase
MSMLHTLAAERSQREIWWSFGARNSVEHPFAEESRSLLKQLSRGRGYIVYSRPAAIDRVGADFDAPGHIDTALLERIGVSPGGDFYLCDPSSFLQNMRDGLRNWGVLAGNVRTEIFGSFEGVTPGMARVDHTLTCHKGRPDLAPQSHSRVAGLPLLGIRNSRGCWNWRKPATFRPDGRAGLESVTPA